MAGLKSMMEAPEEGGEVEVATEPGQTPASQDEQDAYELAVAEGMQALYAPKVRQTLIEAVKKAPDGMAGMAVAAVVRDAIVLVDKKNDLPETVILPAAKELVVYALELCVSAGAAQESDIEALADETMGALIKQLSTHYGANAQQGAHDFARLAQPAAPPAEEEA